jgi:cell division protein FtsL
VKLVNILLSVCVMGSALLVVHTQYAARRDFVAIDEAKLALRQIEQDNTRLEVEKRAQATPLRVETLAKEKLRMRSATPAITQYVPPGLVTTPIP